MSAKKKFIILDGNALLHRAFHALPPMTTKDGTLVNAVYGFTNILLKIIKELKPDYICSAFDRAGKSKRAEEFAAYKAQRVKQPDELYHQIPIIEKMLAAFNIPVIDSQKDGYEADDVIGSVVTKIKDKHPDIKSTIVTGDLDALQLADENIEIFTFKKGISESLTYSPATVKQRYDLNPDQLIDYKALRGDPSDNIPGVKGIGEKTATELIKKFDSLEKLYQAIEKNDEKLKKFKERIINLLKEQKKEAFLSKKLVTIKTNLLTNFKLEQTKIEGFDKNKIVKLFTELEFRSLMNKIPSELAGSETEITEQTPALNQGQLEFINLGTKPPHTKLNYHLIDTESKFKVFFSKLKKQKEFALDTETTSLDVWQAKLLGISFSWKNNEAYFISLRLNEQKKVVQSQEWLKQLKPILENTQVKKIGHNLKYDFEILLNYGIEIKGIEFDSMIAAYLLASNERNLSLDDLVFSELGYQMQPIKELIGPKGKSQLSMAEVELNKLSWYACEDADFTFKLYQKLKPELIKISDYGLLEKIELPLIPILAEMEKTGIKINLKKLASLNKEFSQKIKAVKKKIYKLAGHKFNIASPLQLKEVLFTKLKISTAGLKKIKTGISTAAMELDKMADRHPIIKLISEFREYSKLQNTYLNALPKLVNPKTGRVHTSFNQTVTATGRFSSSNPNLQNIPIRTKIGKEIRKVFIAERGLSLISADYSQIELRVIASLAKDKKMIESFKKGEDIHKRTAANINKVAIEKVKPEQRYAAKEVNFGVIYGLGHVGLAQRTGISREEAKMFIEEYFAIHPAIKKWLDQTKKLAHQKGFVEDLFGRRRYLPNINSGIQLLQAAAERMAINMPIQGTAADLLKLAMIKIHKELPKISKTAKMLLTVHDELVFEVKDSEVKKISKFVKEIMENIYTLNVPIKVEVNSGKNWGECK
ncbi:DNA polymerase I [Patescibacteria group bacterium]|nr:DNA polymerase I [Patescibacteria group bacterium]